jgi:hypothetical protein
MKVRRVSKRMIGNTIKTARIKMSRPRIRHDGRVRKFAQRYLVVFFTEGKDTRIVTVYHASDTGGLISRKLQRGAWVEKK